MTGILLWNDLSVALKILSNGSSPAIAPFTPAQKWSSYIFVLTAMHRFQFRSNLTFDPCHNDPDGVRVSEMEIYYKFVPSLVQCIGQYYGYNMTVCASYLKQFLFCLLEYYHDFSVFKCNLVFSDNYTFLKSISFVLVIFCNFITWSFRNSFNQIFCLFCISNLFTLVIFVCYCHKKAQHFYPKWNISNLFLSGLKN